MCTKLKRFTFEAIMLALMSLIFYGCSSTSTSVAPAQRTVNGVVSGGSGGQPFANAEVTAYAVDGTTVGKAAIPLSVDGQVKVVLKDVVGKVATTPLSATVRSDGRGNFSLKIPESYSGAILIVAKETSVSGVPVTYRSVLPSVSQDQIVYISPATDMVYQYVIANKGGSFTAENIRIATMVLEPFLGVNFTQIPPPALGAAPTAAQQQLLVITQAINAMINSGNYTLQGLVTAPDGGTIALGTGDTFTAFTNAQNTAISNLTDQGTFVPGSYTPPATSPVVTEPSPEVMADITAPSAPQNLTETHTFSSVNLAWQAATDNVAVTGYYVYRNDSFLKALPASASGFIDNTVTPSTSTSSNSYTYDVRARDAAGNISAASTIFVTTSVIPTYAISGRVTTSTGAALASAYVVISGSGSGIYVTDANGNYSIIGVRAGEYTITPALSGYIFTPVNRLINVTTENITGADFAAVNTGTVTGDFTYPPGTIIGGISYPLGTVIGNITYPTATVIGGVTYPTGTVIGGVTYPNGVIIGGVSYPAGTIVGGVAFPVGALTAGITYPTGVIIGGVTYPSGTVNAGITYPTGSATGVVSYPSGTVFGGVTYPSGTVIGGVSYPNGTVIGGTAYPGATVNAGVTYPAGSAIGIVTYPNGTVIGGLNYPNGTIIGGSTYPNGTVIGNLSYPAGSFSVALIYHFSISGYVPEVGVNVALSGSASGTTTTDVNGNYFFTGLVNGDYSITPAGYTPVNITVSNDNSVVNF